MASSKAEASIDRSPNDVWNVLRDFGGLAEFKRQMDFIADTARKAKPRPGGDPVRLPGERGMQRYREQLERGVALYPTILPALKPWAEKYGVAAPAPVS